MATLCFRLDGTFTIAQFTDIHWGNGDELDVQSRALMEQIMQAEHPDLVVFTGDVIASYLCADPIQSFKDAVSIVEESGIPWVVTFGNHDSEMSITRPELAQVVSQFELALTERGPTDITGFGNCVLEIVDADKRVANVLYLFDSGNLSGIPHVPGYDWIHSDQIDWYTRKSREYTARNGGQPIPALAFFHIPLPEYDEVWKSQVCHGHKFEGVCSPSVNSGLFTAMVEMGDVLGTFVGHDHTNDYFGTLHGIRLCYGRATGYNGYGREGFPRGSRIIRLRLGSREFESWLRLDDGSVVLTQPEHQPSASVPSGTS